MAKTTKQTDDYRRLGFAFNSEDEELLRRIQARLQKRIEGIGTVSQMATIRYALKHLADCEK